MMFFRVGLKHIRIGQECKQVYTRNSAKMLLPTGLENKKSSAYLNGLYWSSALNKTADYFNFITTTRNGPYGYPTWKQIRTGETPVARKLRETNRISLALPPTEVSVALTNGTTHQTVPGLKSNGFVDYTEHQLVVGLNPQ